MAKTKKRTRSRKPRQRPTSPIRKPETRSERKEYRDKVLKEEREKAKREQAELQQRREEALANRPPAPKGSLGDGSFYITFLKMGQGDCCIMATPKGRIVMIDCGSDSREEKEETFLERVHGVLYDKKFLKASRTVDALILTHPDTDHYNHLQKVLDNNVQFNAVYHSAIKYQYSEGGTSGWIWNHLAKGAAIRQVLHHKNDGVRVIKLGDKHVAAATETQTIDRLDGKGGIRIIDEPDCKISLLAGGVAVDYERDNSNVTNRGSLVTLIEVFGQRILMCGDATRSTERYVLDQHKNRIQRVTVAQAGHHGSDRTSSLPEYVNWVAPCNVVVSAGRQVVKDHLPSWAVIKRYLNVLDPLPPVPQHEIFYWEQGGLGSYLHSSTFIDRPVYITGSWSTYHYAVTNPSKMDAGT
jgi:beta-lactamase superfamily II metal-dependent hydrolase